MRILVALGRRTVFLCDARSVNDDQKLTGYLKSRGSRLRMTPTLLPETRERPQSGSDGSYSGNVRLYQDQITLKCLDYVMRLDLSGKCAQNTQFESRYFHRKHL